MFQRDFLLNEVHKFAEMLARLMDMKAEGKAIEFNEETCLLGSVIINCNVTF